MNPSARASSRCVLLFARAPRAEAALKGLRGGEALFELSQARVRGAVAALPGVELVLVPPAAQAGAGFGEKLEAAFRDAARRGFEEIVAVPGDVPQLGAGDLAAAFRALSDSDTVVGPSRDGGVWLIGIRSGAVSPSEFFEGVPWLTARVFEALVSNAPDSTLLGELPDVDRCADASRLRNALRASKRDAVLLTVLDSFLGRQPVFSPWKSRPESPPPLSAPLPSRAPPLFLLTF